jgi:hypothetical protein
MPGARHPGATRILTSIPPSISALSATTDRVNQSGEEAATAIIWDIPRPNGDAPTWPA